jgi:pSer/pThr/pTyr-binding forkhead associated (FHA) protein
MADQIAKLTWHDPETGKVKEYVLEEGATASIGRSSSNDIMILHKHVSRQHAVIVFRDGVFMVSDTGSVNGTFVNDQAIDKPFPLFAGDVIRLYGPSVTFSAANPADIDRAKESGYLITTTVASGKGRLIVTTGPQEGTMIPLVKPVMVIGRATATAGWEVALQDPSVSRPHARLSREGNHWRLFDLQSSNGTQVNEEPLTDEAGVLLTDGDMLSFGHTRVLFRQG